jgi:uncharacterized membrane protein
MHPRAWSKVFFSPLFVAVVFIVAGVFHFLFPGAYTGIVPPMLPHPKVLVLISGAAEIAGGAGVLLPATRRVAGLGIILLLIAVFPANVQMLINHLAEPTASWFVAALWLRLPLQPLMIVWVWRVTQY